jgi:hypothetical protein
LNLLHSHNAPSSPYLPATTRALVAQPE